MVAVRLAWTIVQASELEEKPTRILFGGDSETVLAAREKACGALGEYFGNRIGECWDLQEKIEKIVPVGVCGQGEWYHMPSEANAADRPSRVDSSVVDLGIGSVWQLGTPYMLKPFEEWPWERIFATRKVTDLVPRAEMTSKYRGLSAGTKVIKEEENMILTMLDHGYITNDYDVLIQKTEPLFRWAAKVRASKMPDVITLTSRDMAVKFWFRVSMAATRVAMAAGRLKELTLQDKDGMLVIRGRAAACLGLSVCQC